MDSKQENNNQLPLSCALVAARMEIINAVNNAMQKYKLPVPIMDNILSSLQADLRAQAQMELAQKIITTQGADKNE